jgi:hypothetical protein
MILGALLSVINMVVDMFRNFDSKNIDLMEECVEMLHRLEIIDPSRSGYYKDTRK